MTPQATLVLRPVYVALLKAVLAKQVIA